MIEQTKTGIPAEDLESLIEILMKNKNIEEIILFGSRAKGTYTNGSDIDLTIKGDKLKLHDILDAQIELDKLALPWKVDLNIYNRINEPALIEHINRVGIILYRRPGISPPAP